MKDILGQFSRSDFFAVLPPGFYIFVVIYSCMSLDFITPSNGVPILQVIETLANQIKEQPIYLIFVLFSCYMLGSLCRALPVSWAERSFPPFKAGFLDNGTLKDVVDTINSDQPAIKHDIAKMPKLGDKVDTHVFNFWKDILCVNSIEGFSYYQTFETRVRFFSGIIWASWLGILGGLTVMWRECDCASDIGLAILILSLIMLIAFGSNLRRIRREESKALLLLYSAYLQKL